MEKDLESLIRIIGNDHVIFIEFRVVLLVIFAMEYCHSKRRLTSDYPRSISITPMIKNGKIPKTHLFVDPSFDFDFQIYQCKVSDMIIYFQFVK